MVCYTDVVNVLYCSIHNCSIVAATLIVELSYGVDVDDDVTLKFIIFTFISLSNKVSFTYADVL